MRWPLITAVPVQYPKKVAVGSITLEDVGDMVETKQALTEAVLWPLQHPDTFARLGVDLHAVYCSTDRPVAERPSWCARWPVPAGSACTPSRAPS